MRYFKGIVVLGCIVFVCISDYTAGTDVTAQSRQEGLNLEPTEEVTALTKENSEKFDFNSFLDTDLSKFYENLHDPENTNVMEYLANVIKGSAYDKIFQDMLPLLEENSKKMAISANVTNLLNGVDPNVITSLQDLITTFWNSEDDGDKMNSRNLINPFKNSGEKKDFTFLDEGNYDKSKVDGTIESN